MVVLSRTAFRHAVAVVAVVALALTVMVGLGSRPASASSCHPYPDVSSSNSACANIAWLKGQEITKPADGLYHPTASVTRGAMAAFLFRLTHPGESSPACRPGVFPDVHGSNVFCGYITWAKKAGIAQGYPDGTYRSDNAVTRGAMAAYLHRIAAPGQGSKKCTSRPFDDVATSDTFCGVITWMAKTGVTAGIAGTNDYGTTRPVTRQAMASFLHRMSTGPLALMGHYYVGVGNDLWPPNSNDEEAGIWFVDNEWAYWGRPTKGTPTCTRETAKVTSDYYVGRGWGCIRYHFDSTTNKLTVGSVKGIHDPSDDSVKIRGIWFIKTYLPEPGTRFRANLEFNYLFGSGGAGVSGISTHDIALNKKGQFVQSSSTIAVTGGSDYPWNGGVGSFPPDKRGTYRVLPDARIKFTFDSGKTEVHTIAVQSGRNGRPDPAGANGGGLVIGRHLYFTPM